MGPGGIAYNKVQVVAGPLESLIDLLLPVRVEDYDAVSSSSNSIEYPVFIFVFFFMHQSQDFAFSFLLSSRLFIRPHELLGTLLDTKQDHEPLDDMVRLLKTWTRTFPYDFRDERMMSHIKHIASR